MAARSYEWGVSDLAVSSSVDLSAFSIDVATTLVQWVYTDILKIPESADDVDGFTLDLMKAASCYKLAGADGIAVVSNGYYSSICTKLCTWTW